MNEYLKRIKSRRTKQSLIVCKQVQYMIASSLLLVAMKAWPQNAMPDTVCIGATRHYKVNGPGTSSTYRWKIDGGVQTTGANEMVITWNTAGTFLITVQEYSVSGCEGDIRSGYVHVVPAFTSIHYNTITVQQNSATQLTARYLGNDFSYSWEPRVGLNSYNIIDPVFSYNSTTEYTITITSPFGCAVVDTLLIRVPITTSLCGDIWMPTAWTPNGDGHNDKLRVLTKNIQAIKYFRVFNRWGELVFESKVMGEGWNGIYKGKLQVSDAYAWICEAIDNCGKIIRKAGTSTLIK